MRIVITSALLALSSACATAPAAPADTAAQVASSAAHGATDDGVEVRLGCTLVTRAQVDDELARLRLVEPDATRARARELAVRRAVVREYAWRQHLEVSPDQLDREVSRIATQSGLSVEDAYAVAAEHGVDRDAYRAELALQLLEERVLQLLARPPAEAEVAAEIERLRAEAPELSEEQLRDDAEQATLRRGGEVALSDLIRRMREARPRATPDGCADDA